MKSFLSSTDNFQNINVEFSINSGQVFLWKKLDKKWYGVNGQDILVVNENPFHINSYSKNLPDFFREKDDLKKIIQSISKDTQVNEAVRHCPGLRLLRQDPFQCYISFIVSSNSNIQNIKFSLENLCKKFGNKIKFDGKEFFLFPEPEKLANAKKSELHGCGLGYRDEFVKKAAKNIVDSNIDFDFLKKMDYDEAKKALLSVFGIGNKVADCILLFSLDKLESFPIDTWMLKILKKYYSNKFQFEGTTLTGKKYDQLHKKIVKHFGPYAGYAQQFLFKMERDLNQKKWL